MNGHTEMPVMTFSPECGYDILDMVNNWGVRVWFTQGVILTGIWRGTDWDEEHGEDRSTLILWSEKDRDYTGKQITFPTDDVTRIEVL